MINITTLFLRIFSKSLAINKDKELNKQKMLNILEKDFGHAKSYMSKEAKDGNGNPMPWFTYPSIEFLNSLDISRLSIFEYGSGIGTLYWHKHAKSVVSVESDSKWYEKVKILSKSKVILAKNKKDYINMPKKLRTKFDVIVIDGRHRYDSARVAIKCLNKNGMIILDNSEWFGMVAKYLRSNGFKQIDFSGFGPVVYFPWKTSIFAKSIDSLKYKNSNYQPIGAYKQELGKE